MFTSPAAHVSNLDMTTNKIRNHLEGATKLVSEGSLVLGGTSLLPFCHILFICL